MNIVKSVLAQSSNINDYKLNLVSNRNIDLGLLVSRAINILLIVAGVIAVIYLIYSGILYLTAAGNPDAAKKGQQGIVNAIIGIVVILLAYVIVVSVSRFLEGQVR